MIQLFFHSAGNAEESTYSFDPDMGMIEVKVENEGPRYVRRGPLIRRF